MTFGIGISFPNKPSKEDIKKLKRDRFGVVDGGKKPSANTDQDNPIAKRIEVHSGHQKLVMRDMRTGRYTQKR